MGNISTSGRKRKAPLGVLGAALQEGQWCPGQGSSGGGGGRPKKGGVRITKEEIAARKAHKVWIWYTQEGLIGTGTLMLISGGGCSGAHALTDS